MGSDDWENILIVIIAFIFAVTISNTITKESSAMSDTKGSWHAIYLKKHYICYTVFKDVRVSMYYQKPMR